MLGHERSDASGDVGGLRVPFVDLRLEPLVRPDGRARPDLRHRRSVGERPGRVSTTSIVPDVVPTPPCVPAGQPERELPPGLIGRPTASPGLTYRALRLLWR